MKDIPMTMPRDEVAYALAKQVPELAHTCTFTTNFGDLTLRGEAAVKVATLVKRLLEAELEQHGQEAANASNDTQACPACHGFGTIVNPHWEAFHRVPANEMSAWITEQGYASLAAFTDAAGSFSFPCEACGGEGHVSSP